MNFYVLGKIPAGPYRTTFSKLEPVHRADAPQCPACGTDVGMLVWLPPYRATIEASSSKLGDVTSTLGDSMLVSERFRHAWEERGLKGIKEFTPLERIRVRPARLGKPSPVYYHIAPQPFGAKIDFARSKFKHGGMITCDYCRSMPGYRSVNGFTIEEGTWTGEDIVRPWGLTGMVLVTDRVRQLRDDYDLKNIELTPIEEYSYPPEYKASSKNE
jgi:hypothetical protein